MLRARGFSLSPRGDGNLSVQPHVFNASRDFLYPREGTETLQALLILCRLFRFSLSPRGDGSGYVLYFKQSVVDFLYPREGTETAPQKCPRGRAWIFFIPARGRKHKCIHPPATDADFLYPREGTETQWHFFVVLLLSAIFFIPARGRKHFRIPFHPRAAMIFFVPARGRKPVATISIATISRFSLSPRGDGNKIFGLAKYHHYDFLYPREGTETARLYMTGAIKLGIFFIPARGRHSQQKSTFLPSIYLQAVRNVLN